MSVLRNLSFLVLSPYLIGFTPGDSAFTEMAFGIGTGQYTVHDCSGSHQQTFVDGGIRATHKFEGPFRVGLALSPVAENSILRVLPYPDIALDTKYFAIGTTGARVGPLDYLYAELALGDQVPAFSGKGFVRYGVGWIVPDWDTRFWIGQNQIPYGRVSWAGQIDLPVSAGKYIFINGRLGRDAGIEEYGLSIGFRLRFSDRPPAK